MRRKMKEYDELKEKLKINKNSVLNILQTSYSIINKKHRTKLNFLYIIFFVSMILETMSMGMFIPI